MTRYKTFPAPISPTLRLALPLVLAEVGWMVLAMVNTMIVGRLPNGAIAVGLCESRRNSHQRPRHVSGAGLLIGLDTLVSQRGTVKRGLHRSLYTASI